MHSAVVAVSLFPLGEGLEEAGSRDRRRSFTGLRRVGGPLPATLTALGPVPGVGVGSARTRMLASRDAGLAQPVPLSEMSPALPAEDFGTVVDYLRDDSLAGPLPGLAGQVT